RRLWAGRALLRPRPRRGRAAGARAAGRADAWAPSRSHADPPGLVPSRGRVRRILGGRGVRRLVLEGNGERPAVSDASGRGLAAADPRREPGSPQARSEVGLRAHRQGRPQPTSDAPTVLSARWKIDTGRLQTDGRRQWVWRNL